MAKEKLIKILEMCSKAGTTPIHNAVWQALDKYKDDESVKSAFEEYLDSKSTYRRMPI